MSINWKNKFSRKILERGREYFYDGNVGEIKKLGDSYKSTVYGNKNYSVTINLEKNKIDLFCTCPFFTVDNCKHAAAMLFKMESENLIEDDSKKQNDAALEKIQCFPFKDYISPSDGYHYFDMEKMTSNLIFTKENVELAKKLINNKKVSLDKINYLVKKASFDEENIFYGDACASVYEEKTRANISIRFTKNRITMLFCSKCSDYTDHNRYYTNSKNPVCAHATAALLMLGEKLKQENPGDETDISAYELIKAFRNENYFNTKLKNEIAQKITIEPRLDINYPYSIYMGLKIGTKRLYIVKNFLDLLDDFEKKAKTTLGKDNSIDFSTDYFDETSKKYFDLAKRIIRAEDSLDGDPYSYTHSNIKTEASKGRILLYGKYIDDFFDIANGAKIRVRGLLKNWDESDCFFLEKNPDIKIKLEAKSGNFGIERITATAKLPKIVIGEKFNYSIEKTSFCRISSDASDRISLLKRNANRDNDFSFSIGRKSLSEFTHRILPWLKEFADVDESAIDEIRESLPPEVHFKFYLDRIDETVTCQIASHYGENVFFATDFIIMDNEPAEKQKHIDDFRDSERENQVLKLTVNFFDTFSKEDNLVYTSDEDKIFEFLNSGLTRLMEIGEVNTTENFLRLKIHHHTKVSVGVSIKSNLLDLEISSEGHTREELFEILDGMKKKKKFVRLRNGDFVNTDDESLGELKEMLDSLQISAKDFAKGKMHIPQYRALYLDKMLESNSQLYAERDKNFRKLVKEFKTVDDSDFEVPSSLASTMRPYQVFGHKWFRTLQAYNFGGILADDMGLGKTLQAISVILSAKENLAEYAEQSENAIGENSVIPEQNEAPSTSLIVCPASLVYNWGEEFKKFAPSMKVILITGTQNERAEKIAHLSDFDAAVTSYDLLKRDIAEYEEKNFLFQIIDEAQFIKNSSTAAAKAVKAISAKHKFALTGTPIENRLSELWSIFDFLMPGFLYGSETFRKDFETPIVKNQDEKAMARLKKMVSPFILRRLKGDVLKDLPDKIEEIRYAKFEDAQQKLYDAQALKIRQIVEEESDDNFNKGKIQILAELTKIRQICCDPTLLFENYSGESAKRIACLDLLKSGIEGGHKILLFSQFTSMLELLESDLKKEKISYYKITGETPKEKRVELVNLFNSDETPVFLISLKAGGTGLNLTGADIVIHYDPWWNLAVQNQATDRAHRIGQTKVVSVFKLIAKGSIEEKIVEMQNSKKDLAEEILSGETGGIAQMTKEEILSLL